MDNCEFQKLIDDERKMYLTGDERTMKQIKKYRHKRYYIWKYLYCFRCCQYWREVRYSKSTRKIMRRYAKLKFRYYDRLRGIYSYKSGVEIGINCNIGKNCDIWHSGVVINGDVGDNCVFHGNNIIGNKGIGFESKTPQLGNRVDVGAGAVIIGNVCIADDSVVGAGAVVTKTFEKAGSVIVGVPGKQIN